MKLCPGPPFAPELEEWRTSAIPPDADGVRGAAEEEVAPLIEAESEGMLGDV